MQDNNKLKYYILLRRFFSLQCMSRQIYKYSGLVNHILISIPKFPILQIDKGVARKCTQN